MCGIAGFSGNYSQSLLHQMADSIQHRGPDDCGEVILQNENYKVGLAHTRLSIIDLSKEGHQPMTVSCTCCRNAHWLVFNGEIYNYKLLRDDLIKKGHQFHSQSDSEVLLHLYSEYGEAMLAKLRGIFSFAIFDGNKRGQLFLARDHLGVKPLYYAETNSGFLFSSELKAILQSKDVSRELNPRSIEQHLTYIWNPAPDTMLQHVHKFEPGQAMLVLDGKIVKQWDYYTVPYGQAYLKSSEADIAEQLASKVEDAVSTQLISDVPVGAFLSGGLDSSSIVAMMRKTNPDTPVQCYTIGLESKKKLEDNVADLPYAKKVSQHLGTDLSIVSVDADIVKHLPHTLYYLDEPQAEPSAINTMLIAEQAKKDGIKVLMSGAGGDDILSGYRRHQVIQNEQYWMWLPKPVKTLMASTARATMSGDGIPFLSKHSLSRRLAKLTAYIDQPEDERIVNYFYWSTEKLRRRLFSSDLRDKLSGYTAAVPLLNSLSRIHKEQNKLNKMLYLESRFFLPDLNLNFTDKAAMAHGVEVRVPLIDTNLVDYATQIPPNLKQKGRVGKSIFKKSMEPYLPNDVIYRPKTGFGAPMRQWIQNDLRELVDETLSEKSILNRGLFDPRAIQELIKNDRNGHVDAAYIIFVLIGIEQWCRIFVDSDVPRLPTGFL